MKKIKVEILKPGKIYADKEGVVTHLSSRVMEFNEDLAKELIKNGLAVNYSVKGSPVSNGEKDKEIEEKDKIIEEKDKEIEELKKGDEEKDKEIEELKKGDEEKDKEIEELKKVNEELEKELEKIKTELKAANEKKTVKETMK